MLTLQKLKELKQANRDKLVIYKLLSTIIGECEQISKNPSNNEIVRVLQKVYKDNDITLKECSKDRVNLIQELNEENSFLSQYLPTPLTDEELLALIGSQMSEGKRMPDIMKYLSTNYESRYDGKKAILIINSLL
jgi:uncharacterized protein YqeY